MSYENSCSEIIALFVAAGKEIPTQDSDTGIAIQILQEICDSQNHTIPNAQEIIDTMQTELESLNWSFDFGIDGAFKSSAMQDGDEATLIETLSQNSLVVEVASFEGIDNPTSSDASEIFDALDAIEGDIGDDFNLDFDGNEYRIIAESAIWEIYRDEIQQTVEDCYDLNLGKLPSFIAFSINWEQTAKNCYSDGYGHTFSGYDGSEEEIAGYWIFRTN